MNTEYIVSKIYPEVHMLKELPHPVTNRIYRNLSDEKLIALANETLDVLLKMGIEQILVSESGAVPFAKICAWIANKRNLRLKWYSIKIPRNIKESFAPTFNAYLSLTIKDLQLVHSYQGEFKAFHFAGNKSAELLPENYFELPDVNLKDILNSLNVYSFSNRYDFLKLSQASALAKILTKPFIFFDEYIDSGKTLLQSFRFFNLFAKELNYKIFSYMIKLRKDELNPDVCQSLYTLDNQYDAYQTGVYPFENRIDWLGYFYTSNQENFEKTPIANCYTRNSFNDTHIDGRELSMFINSLYKSDLLDAVKAQCQIKVVAKWITPKHLVQYLIYKLEESTFGKTPISKLLYQLFDMYGPRWSPLPDEYHLSYINAFESIDSEIMQCFSNDTLVNIYRHMRYQIIQPLVKLLNKRYLQKQHQLLNTLENHHAA